MKKNTTNTKKEETRKVNINGQEFEFTIDQMVKFIETISNPSCSESILTPKKSAGTKKADSKESEATPKRLPEAVGCLEFDGLYVKTVSGKFISKKQRYAIQCSITEKFNGEKLKKGDDVYDKLVKKDKYVQVYKFKTKKDCDAFKKSQQEYLK